MVILQHWRQRHPDHAAASRIVYDACFLAGLRNYRPDLGPAFRPAKLVYTVTTTEATDLRPTFVVDVTAFWETKLRAISAFASQFAPYAYSGDPDFNYRSFRMTNVLRWEYRPGSALYVVWQQGREDPATQGRFHYGSDVGSLFGTPIISQPQVAILGVGGIEKRPVVVQDAIAILRARFARGEISQDEFERHKNALMQKFRDAVRSAMRMSGRELADTIVQMMDAQDKQWNSELNFSTMHVYYHIKGTSEGASLSPFKQDYQALKWLVDDLETENILRRDGGAGFLLTGIAELFYHWNVRTPHWLGYFVQRPESHCVHHQRGRHRNNYSDLPLWDIAFGTFSSGSTLLRSAIRKRLSWVAM